MSQDPSIIASDPNVSAWVAAHAGAGKTHTLANRVARLLLDENRPERILCLTFTKAAAAEMQQRLFKTLGSWAMLPDEALRESILAIGGGADISLRQARRLFARALETPGGLKVLTIHAFCQILLSRFPVEAGIPPAFEVLDDTSSREMIAEARQRMLERAGNGDARLAAAVAYLVTETSEARLIDVLDTALGGDRRKLDRFFASVESLTAAARAPYGLKDGETAHSIAADFCATLAGELKTLRAVRAWLAGGSANDQKAAARLEPILASAGGAEDFSAFHTFLMTGTGEPRQQMATKKLVESQPALLDYLKDLQQRYCDAAERRRGARAAELTEAALTLIEAVRGDYQAAKRRRGVLDYDDLIIETRNLLHKRGAAAWVLYKLDGGIDHVLIDEAQDTSPEQWDIVRKLTEEFFAGEGRAARIRTIFAVGDEKQSIFSFQGADPSQFDRNRQHFAALAEGANHPFRDQPLTTSRRSAPQILQFVDAVFAGEAARAGLTFSGDVIMHQAHRKTAPGGIAFWPTLKPQDREEIDPWKPVDSLQEDSPAARLAVQVADRIAGWLHSGARLPGHGRPIAPRDIMILLPRREPFGGEVIRQLKQRKVPVAGADRVRLTEQIAAMDLIALGRFTLQREDDLTLAALLRSPLCGLSETDLYTLAHGRKADLWNALTARRKEFAAAHDFLAAMLERADYAPPFEFYSHALTALGAREKLLARLGPESADTIEEFLSLTLTHERGHSPSLEGFLDWVERGGTEIKRDMEHGRDEVRVMTVHGAKGLEADIVILPDTASLPGGLNRSDGLLYAGGGVLFPLPKQDAPPILRQARADADEERMKEHRRLFYVALTRARDRLHICGFEGRNGVRDGTWYALAREAADRLGMTVLDESEVRGLGTLDHETGGARDTAQTRAPLPSWIAQAAPREPALPRLIRPSDVADVSAAASPLGGGAQRFRRGLVVHALLARLPELPREQRREAALRFAAAQGYDAALVDETLAVLDDPRFAAAFAPDSRAEVAFLADLPQFGDGAQVTGRIDRLAVSDSEVLILDYKTNRPPPAREEDVSTVYLSQMALYRAGAERIFPGRRIVCGLLWTDGPVLLRLSDRILDAQLADLAGRLDRQGGRS